MAACRELLLLRHGLAEERSPALVDAERALTSLGRRRTAAVIEHLVALNLCSERLISSPLRRARETAELALAGGLAPALEIDGGLAPESNPMPLLEGSWRRLLLVGHEPDLSLLAARLLKAPPQVLRLRKAGLILLEFPEPASPGLHWPLGEAQLSLLLSPRSLGACR